MGFISGCLMLILILPECVDIRRAGALVWLHPAVLEVGEGGIMIPTHTPLTCITCSMRSISV